jgi:arylsulfatase A-like enzyme
VEQEGGVRGVGFIHWPGLAPALQGTVSTDVVAVADWLPTFVAGVAGLELEPDSFRYGLDGVNQWTALTNPAASTCSGEYTHVMPLRFKLDGRSVWSARWKVETARSERKRLEI